MYVCLYEASCLYIKMIVCIYVYLQLCGVVVDMVVQLLALPPNPVFDPELNFTVFTVFVYCFSHNFCYHVAVRRVIKLC